MALTGAETSVVCRSSLASALEALAEDRFDLLILDVNLPDGSGLETGANDYITKPFSLAVLRARVNAQLRRGAGHPHSGFELPCRLALFRSGAPAAGMRHKGKHKSHPQANTACGWLFYCLGIFVCSHFSDSVVSLSFNKAYGHA